MKTILKQKKIEPDKVLMDELKVINKNKKVFIYYFSVNLTLLKIIVIESTRV
jgi:hypothetical protein